MISLKKAFIIAALTSLLTGSAVAVFLLTRQITNIVTVTGAANFVLVREDDLTTEITKIEWGAFQPLESKNSNAILETGIMIKNTGNVPIVVGWNATGLDRSRWNITATTSGNPYPENNYELLRIDPGYVGGYVIFTLTNIDPYTPPGDYSFTINFNAQQAPA